MIQTILLTVLFTILGVGIVISLIWLMVISWNAKKLSKANSEDIQNLYNSLSTNVDGVYKTYDEQIKDIRNDMNNRVIGVYTDMDKRIVEVYRNYDSQIKDVYSKMDSRFDKSISKLMSDYKKDVIQVHKVQVPQDDIWVPVENERSSEKKWNLSPPTYSGDFASAEAQAEWFKNNPPQEHK